MMKNDKIIVVLGVATLIFASIGVYYWVPNTAESQPVNANEFIDVTGNLKDMPGSITVSDSCPFYPLIATPLSVNYDENGEQSIIPLYVMNFDNPSTAVTRLQDQLDHGFTSETIKDDESAENASLRIAKTYWSSSEAALIIEYDEPGYDLGVLATPIASYLRIPVIVTKEMGSDVISVLNDLGVEKTIVCGENIKGFGYVLRFNSVDEVLNASIIVVENKLNQNVDYITLTNPVDAWPPMVLDSQEFTFGPTKIKSGSMSQLVSTALGLLSGKGSVTWSFTIPKDYKYALIKFEGINHDAENCDDMGDRVSFMMGPNLEGIPAGLQKFEVNPGGTNAGGIAERDASGNIIKDVLYSDSVVYGRGGVEYTIVASGNWLVKKEGEVSARVVVEKLEDPVYPMMKCLSSVAPYLTAYHKGIIFGTPDFAFTADDDKITDTGETCPGLYVGGKNPNLVPISNKHFFDKIHDPLNALLAHLADIPINDDRDIKTLRDYYKTNPVYIALVGDATVLPNYFYQNHVEPIGDVDGDGVDDTTYYNGGGTPSDVLYGNIDPIPYDWSNLANDVYSDNENKYPFIENIVGRITGWDAQDADALILKSVFYHDLTSNLNTWKDNYGLIVGGGQDFQKPLVRYIIFGDLFQMIKRGEPMKAFTGYAEMTYKRAAYDVVEPLGFNLQGALYEEGMEKGLSEQTLSEIKSSNILNKLFFEKWQVRRLAGEGSVKGGDIFESSNFLFVNGHGNQFLFGVGGNDIVASGLGGPLVKRLFIQTVIPIAGGFIGPGGDLSSAGEYNTRTVSNMNLGPSFMWLESCICGKLDGMYARTNIGQSLLHAGVASLIASPTGSNIGGGYLEPKKTKYDFPIQTYLKYFKAKGQWKRGIFPDAHFGEKIYEDLCSDMKKFNSSVGLALRNARNNYLSADADWQLWWSPPLNIYTGNTFLDLELAKSNNADLYKSTASKGLSAMMESKYVSFQEYILFGDPALNTYEPCNEGK
ncbi:MAG TPA: C25 family cysteine peptidase [Candidatus Thermoplasmatota archaeon]|nr:C25 family cysteine peptidase [Candidatus Thermoplasmatota archaeon]